VIVNGTLGRNRARRQTLEVSICVRYSLIRFSAAACAVVNKTITTIPIGRLIFSPQTISIVEVTECIVHCNSRFIDVLPFLDKAQSGGGACRRGEPGTHKARQQDDAGNQFDKKSAIRSQRESPLRIKSNSWDGSLADHLNCRVGQYPN
jgi:hypothetical protein